MPVKVNGQRTEDESKDDEEKLKQVFADVDLLNSFRRYIMLLSDLSEHTVDKYYGMTDSGLQYAQQFFVEKRQVEAEQNEAKGIKGALETNE